MKYKAKSILIARKSRKNKEDLDHRPCFISLFEENEPHKNPKGPREVIEFDRKHRVEIEGLNVHYLLPGNDIVINNLEEIEVVEEGDNLKITGQHC